MKLKLKYIVFLIAQVVCEVDTFGQSDTSLLLIRRNELLDTITVTGEGYLLEGRKIGNWKYFSLNEELIKENVYMIDTTNNTYLGSKIRGFLSNYKIDQTLLSYEEKIGSSVSENMFAIISVDNPIIEYYPNGNIKGKVVNEKDSLYYSRYKPNGSLEMKSEIINGDIKGKYWLYYENGTVRIEGTINDTYPPHQPHLK